MHIVTFIVAALFIIIAAILFGLGLVRLYRDNDKARGLISSGFMVGLLGVVVAVVIFGFFNL
jgi:FtsH-binding integral membrane protein